MTRTIRGVKYTQVPEEKMGSCIGCVTHYLTSLCHDLHEHRGEVILCKDKIWKKVRKAGK
jgi:hypothetical protein